MRIQKVRAAVEKAEQKTQDASNCLSELAVILKDAKYSPDPFAAHVFHSRHDYKESRKRDGKGQRASEMSALISHQEAGRLGYKGSEYEWDRILQATGELPELYKTLANPQG